MIVFVALAPSIGRVYMPRPRKESQAGYTEKLMNLLADRGYAANTRPITLADRRTTYHTDDNDSPTNDWRNVMEAKFGQCFTNAFLLFKKWVALLKSEVEEKLRNKSVEITGSQVLEKALKELGRLSKIDRTAWDRKLATVLMEMCDVSTAGKGGKPSSRSQKAA